MHYAKKGLQNTKSISVVSNNAWTHPTLTLTHDIDRPADQWIFNLYNGILYFEFHHDTLKLQRTLPM
jgi:hypothetical protein